MTGSPYCDRCSAACFSLAMSISTLQGAVENGSLSTVPPDYIIPEMDRARQNYGDSSRLLELPVIEMVSSGGGFDSRGVSGMGVLPSGEPWGAPGVDEADAASGARVFELPVEEKEKYAVTPESQTLGSQGYGSKFKPKEGAASNWGDQLRHRTLPVSARQYGLWPTKPPSYRYASTKANSLHRA